MSGRFRRAVRYVSAAAGVLTLAGTMFAGNVPAQAATAGQARVSRAQASHAQASHAAARLKPVVRTAVRHGKSGKLRSLRPLRGTPRSKVKPLPVGIPPHHPRGKGGKTITARVQRGKTVSTDTMPSFGQNFEGVSNLNGVFPPDTNMAVGPNDIVQTVNFSVAVYDKQGNTLLGPENLGTLWQGFGGECDPSVDPAANGGDPVVMYDENANRFFISQLAYPQLAVGSGGYHECIAVSQTGDPTGAWYLYDFQFSQNTLNDYPKWGVWPDAYYMSNNDFLNGSTFTGVTVTAFDRAQMMAGQQATSVQFTIGSQYSSLLPSNAEGGALGFNPPSGSPNPFFMECDAANGGPCTSDQLDEWDFHVDWSNPANSTFGDNGSPSLTIPVATFNSNLCNYDGNCIPQPGTTQGLDALSDRLMYQSAYRNLGSTQAIVLNQTVNVSSNPTTNPQAGVRWYELTNSGSGWSLAQQGTYAPDSDNRWMGSANIDASGDIGIGYSVSSSTTYPSIRVAGRLPGDPAGELSQGEATLMAGTGSQTGSDPSGRGRWGDYSAMQVDPTDGCTFWYTSEYIQTTGAQDWQTRIGSFKFPSCSAGPSGTISGTVTSKATGSPIAGAAVAAGTAATTTTNSQGQYSMILPTGSYNLTAQAYGYHKRTRTGVQVTQGQTTTENFKLAAVPTHILSGTVTDGSGHGYPLYAKISIQGYPGNAIYTNPYTGQYSISLAQGTKYTLTATPVYPGYNTATASVFIGKTDKTKNLKAKVDQSTCSAPGYAYKDTGTTEGFTGWTGTTPQDGWTNVDNQGNGQDWMFGTNPTGEGQPPGSDGQFAIIDSLHYGYGNNQDTSLVSPVENLSADKTPVINFDTYYEGFYDQVADVDLSLDGGSTWSTVWSQTDSNVEGPVTIQIPQAAGQSNVQVRFHYTQNQDFGFWWSLDNVFIGNQKCVATPGGYVDGIVTDHNTGDPVNGATVASQANPGQSGVTGTTPDPSIPGGFYWLFATPPGATQLTASDSNYTASPQTVNVTSNGVVHQDWSLQAGRLTVTPGSVSATRQLGGTATRKVTIANTGTEPAQVQLFPQNSGFNPMTGGGTGAPIEKIKGHFSAAPTMGPAKDRPKVHATAGQRLHLRQPTASGSAWSAIADYPEAIMDNAVGYDTGTGNVYSAGGLVTGGASNTSDAYKYSGSSQQWSAIAPLPQAMSGGAGAFLNGTFYSIGGIDSTLSPSTDVYAYDPSSDSWTKEADLPQPLFAPAAAVLNGTLYVVGGCAANCSSSSSPVYSYNPSSNSWTALANYPESAIFAGCAGIAGKVVCAGGLNPASGSSYTSTYIYQPSSNSWSQGATMPYDDWGMSYSGANGKLQLVGGVTENGGAITNQAIEYDPSSDSWSALPNANDAVYRAGGSCGIYQVGGTTGYFLPQTSAEVLPGYNQCGAENIPWLSTSTSKFTLNPGQSQTVAVTMDSSTVAQPGAYSAQLAVDANTPYNIQPINVALQANPPSTWSKVAGTVTDASSGNPIAGATVQICTQYDRSTGTCGQVTYTLKTDSNGNYQLWLNRGYNPLQIIAADNGYQPVSKVTKLIKGITTTVNFALTKSS